MELTDKGMLEELYKFKSEMEFLKLLANKALDMAMDSLVKVQAMKESTHQVVSQPLTPEIQEFVEEMKEQKADSEAVPSAVKLSPYNLSLFKRNPTTESPDDYSEDEIA